MYINEAKPDFLSHNSYVNNNMQNLLYIKTENPLFSKNSLLIIYMRKMGLSVVKIVLVSFGTNDFMPVYIISLIIFYRNKCPLFAPYDKQFPMSS